MPRRTVLSTAIRAAVAATLMTGLASCGSGDDDRVLAIAMIGPADSLFDRGVRLSPGARAIRAATAEGLVTVDAKGEIVPALAERWIVTEDGLSYIFRLRNSDWPGGDPIDAEEVRDALRRTLAALRGTSLGLDLAPVSDVRAMTGRVIEIRLASPVPDFLQLLAQPELGILHRGQGGGPMALTRRGQVAILAPLPPEARGEPSRENWREGTRTLAVRAYPAQVAVRAFRDGQVDLVFGGTLADLPLADVGPLSRGTVRLDAAPGLFGLKVLRAEGVLADPARREALAMAIDRDNLMNPFNIAGWTQSTRLIPAAAREGVAERWAGLDLEQRQAEARRRIGGAGGAVRVRLPDGPGSAALFAELAADWRAIGVSAVHTRGAEPADLELVDVLARFGGRRWYLDQLACAVRRPLCSPEADALVAEAAHTPDLAARAQLLDQAEAVLAAQEGYIALGAPVRWSLVRGDVAGYADNGWALHPLFALAVPPT